MIPVAKSPNGGEKIFVNPSLTNKVTTTYGEPVANDYIPSAAGNAGSFYTLDNEIVPTLSSISAASASGGNTVGGKTHYKEGDQTRRKIRYFRKFLICFISLSTPFLKHELLIFKVPLTLVSK